jgi:predicted nucleotidyltransferase
MTDSITDSMEQGAVSGFLDDLKNRMGANLQSVTLYGSAARGDFVAGSSDLNVLVVARTLTAEALREAGDAVRQWYDRLPLSPIFATPDYLENSADVFPLEFLDMREAHVTLFGADPLAHLEIDPRNLRHQVEAELKGKLMRLRSAYARAAGDERAVRALLSESLPSFRVLFQGALRLRGEIPPEDRHEVMRAVAGAFDLDADALDTVAAIRDGAPLPASGAEAVMDRYLSAIETITGAVDAWNDAAG